MKGGKAPLGYTIVEVMVVLAISSVMFLIASQFVNGKQQRAAFTQGANDFSDKLESIAGQVNDGQYTDIDLGTCTAGPTGLSFSATTKTQGTNLNCSFLGKLLYFGAASGNPTSYNLLNLAGAVKNGTIPVTDITSAHPTVIDALTLTQQIPQSLEVAQMHVKDASGTYVDNYSLGFMQGFGAANAASDTGTYLSGSQTTMLVYGTGLSTRTVSNIDTATNGQIAQTAAAEICLTDGTHWAKVTIDTAASGLNANLVNYDNGSGRCW